MTTAYSALTSLLMEEGWSETDRGPAGTLWSRGDSTTPVPYRLSAGSANLTSLLNVISEAEGESFSTLMERLESYLVGPPRDRRTQYDRAELDLHLEERHSKYQHETSAYNFGQFVSFTAQVASDLIRDAAGLARHSRSLQVVAGPKRGSIQVVLREPPEDSLKAQQSLVPRGASAEARALLTLTQIFNAAESSLSDPLNELLPPLLQVGVPARRSIARLARIMVSAGWVTRGNLRRPNEEPLPIEITLAGAHLLQRTAGDSVIRTRKETRHGTIDGWIWSTAELQIIEDNDSRRLRVAVPAALQTEVARLNAEKDQRVTVDMQVSERISPTAQTLSRSYALVHVYPDARLPG